MGCGCGKNKTTTKSSKTVFTDPKWKKCPSCGSKLINIHKYNKSTKKMMSIVKCSNQSCSYVK